MTIAGLEARRRAVLAGGSSQLASVGCRVAPRKPLVPVPRRGGISRNDTCGGAPIRRLPTEYGGSTSIYSVLATLRLISTGISGNKLVVLFDRYHRLLSPL